MYGIHVCYVMCGCMYEYAVIYVLYYMIEWHALYVCMLGYVCMFCYVWVLCVCAMCMYDTLCCVAL